MKKFLAMLLCLCMLVSCALAETAENEAADWLKEKSLALAALTNEAIHSDAYLSLMTAAPLSLSDDLRATDFSAPVSMRATLAPLQAVTELTTAMDAVIGNMGFSPELNDYLLRRTKASLPNLLLASEGTDMILAHSLFSFSDAWLCPDFITSDAHVFLEYEGDYVLWVQFILSDLGTVSGQTSLLTKSAYAKMDTLVSEVTGDILPQ